MGDGPPCRLFVFLAREAPIGVILRRGPTGWARLTLWHTDRDLFVPGQWLRGRVYEDRCDIAPDGSLFLYFARKESVAAQAGGYGHAWTALSRPPYFTALALWPQSSTYLGGGVFLARRTIALNGCPLEPHPDHPPRHIRVRSVRHLVEGWSYQERLVRDGWQRVAGDPPPGLTWPSVARPPSVWRRPNAGGTHAIVMSYPGSGRGDPPALDHSPAEWPAGDGTPGDPPAAQPPADDLPTGFGRYPVQIALETLTEGMVTPIPDATWADWDRHGRLVLTKEGRLYAWDPQAGPMSEPRELADFRSERPDPQPAPAWAYTWGKRPGRR